MTAEKNSGNQTTPANPPRIGFALSTMERVELTAQVLPTLDCGGFDLIWCDGSRTPEGRAFASREHFKKTPLVEVHHDVRGGPDAAIQYSLKRLLALGYDYVGLIENDIVLKPGWLEAMMAAWSAAEKDGFSVGAVTARNMSDRVLACGPAYAVKWNVGAGMVLFSRAAAEAVLADYSLGAAKEIHGNFMTSTGVDLSPAWELFQEKPDRPLGADWRYASVTWKSGKVSVGTVPNMAENIDVDIRDFCRTDYVRSAETGLPSFCLTIDQLKTALVCYAPFSKITAPTFKNAATWLETSGKDLAANCPACTTPAPTVITKKTHAYHRCPSCDCVFTPAIKAVVLETENHGHDLRHNENQDANRLERLAKALGEFPEKLIDFGCGKGETTRYLQAQGLDVTGIDQDTKIQLADVADASVDGIMMVEVIEHLFAPHAIFSQFGRILKPGGVAYIESSFADGKNLAAWEYLDPAIGHCTVHTKRSVQQLAEKNGFVVAWINDNVCTFTKGVPVEQPGAEDGVEIIGAGILNPILTVVVSTYRAEKHMRACLEGLSRQTLFNRCEVIVVDSGSPENERAIVAEFQQKFPNIRYVRTARETLAAAWNRGLALARGHLWASVSTDDSLRNDALEIFAAALDMHVDSACAYADCAWTSKPNDFFPPKHVIKTVKYPDYSPVESLFSSLAGCVQFFRTAALRELGGFDASLRHAGDHDAVLRLMATRKNAVHVPEVLTAYHQNPNRLETVTKRATEEQRLVVNRCRENLGIDQVFQVEAGSAKSAADALAVLGIRAMKFPVSWQDQFGADVEFAAACFHAALELDPENTVAGMNFVTLNYKLQKLEENEADLIHRWPKMRTWIADFRAGEHVVLPHLRHAVVGPVYRPGEWSQRPTAEQLAREPKILHPWITRIEGRHVYLSEDIFPQKTGLSYKPAELDAAAKKLVNLLAEMPQFYAHLGGAGDALLLLASFYDQKPDAAVFCHPNGVGAAKALFDAFPKLSKIYFLPQHPEPFFHIVLRYAVYELKNCLGAGTTPQFGYEEEWKASLDLEKKYRVKKTPRWAAAFRKNEGSKRVAVAPKGSLSGMIGTKRNIILPELWPQVVAHIIARGFEPVILGIPSEAKDYPALPGCVDARGEGFPGQMRLIGECAGLVGADSWAKSFSALAEIPTLVFEPIKGADLAAWKDCSDWVFIEPWPSIKMIRSLEDFKKAFDARIAKVAGAEEIKGSKPVIVWEGSFLDYGSLSHVNRELTSRLPDVTGIGSNVLSERTKNDPEMKRCAAKLSPAAPANTAVTVRHQWPPNWSRPSSGSLVVIQPWEYGVLPKAWVEQSKNVDEFWVPSPLVRHMYVDSGVAPEKVRVIPNGVDTQKFRPGVAPLKLATKKKFKFLFVGGTIYRKGPDILLEAYSRAFTAADDVCLVIKDFGGDSFYQGQTAEAAVQALKKNPNAPEILYLKEELASAQMPALYAGCDCFVLPYRGEGFGMPVLEAMSCGLPVIVTAGGATESFVSAEVGWKIPSHYVRLGDRVGDIALVKRGWLLDPSKPHLSAIMKYALSHPEEARKRGAAGRAVVERRFDWSDVAAAVAHRLKELAELSPIKGIAVQIQPTKPVAVPVKTATKVVPPAVANIGRLDEARELLGQKNYEAAWNAARAAIAQRPFHPEAFLLLAGIALAAGDGMAARQCAEHALAIAPGFEAAKKFLKQKIGNGLKAGTLNVAATIKPQVTPRLSVCLITKNEEKFLAQCLKSVRGLAAQIVVVDTGSTDRTVEIAREFGAELFASAWSDDFAAARNAALEHATGDWVLILDADEEMTAEQHAKLQADMKNATAIGYRLPLVNFGQEDQGRSFIPRLFRNAPGVFFHGRIHEQVFSSLLPLCKQWGLQTALGSAELLHHGYTKEMVRDRNKVARNLNLLQQAIAENPADANLVMNLGLELVRSDDLPAGIVKYREAFDLMSVQPATEVVPELREALLTQFTSQLYKVRGHEEVVRVLNSPLAKNGGLNASLHLALGLAHFELKQFSEAADQMRQCLASNQKPALTPINVDIHGAAPWHCLALCLARTGDAAGAETAFQSATAETRRNEEARLDYARFLRNENRPVDALQQLHQVVTQNPRNLVAWQLGGEIALSRGEFIEFARDWTGEAIIALPTQPVIAEQRAETLLLSGETAAALELWEKIWTTDRQPRSLAALILCDMIEAQTTHAPEEGRDETVTSQAFIAWYQKLITHRVATVIDKVNEQQDKLARALPTAAQILQAALAEAVVETEITNHE
ncbi:MAG TPA: glycosyltransferase [Verrucomicrobiae bacterium]|nr:glycosyltransferase [Verrucomicrobiae bacterium]